MKKKQHVREWFFAILGKHRRDDVNHDIELCLICRGAIDEDIPCIQSNLAVFRVNNRWHRKDNILRIVDYGIYRGIADDMEVSCQMFFSLKMDDQ